MAVNVARLLPAGSSTVVGIDVIGAELDNPITTPPAGAGIAYLMVPVSVRNVGSTSGRSSESGVAVNELIVAGMTVSTLVSAPVPNAGCKRAMIEVRTSALTANVEIVNVPDDAP